MMDIDTERPDRAFDSGLKHNDLGSVSSQELFNDWDMADVYLPVPTETCEVSPESRIVIHTDPRSAGADRMRLVRTRLQQARATKKLKTLLVTSPLPGDGKTTVCLNLATALSEKGRRPVLLLEADVYRPTVCEKLKLKTWQGLTECFDRRRDPMQAIRRIDPLGFYLLPAGGPSEDGSSLIQSSFTSQLITGLAATSFDWVLVDAPPTTPVAEILALKDLTDATLLVARAGVTPRELIEESVQCLGRSHIHGIILNDVEGLDRVYSRYYGHYIKADGDAKPQKNLKLFGR